MSNLLVKTNSIQALEICLDSIEQEEETEDDEEEEEEEEAEEVRRQRLQHLHVVFESFIYLNCQH